MQAIRWYSPLASRGIGTGSPPMARTSRRSTRTARASPSMAKGVPRKSASGRGAAMLARGWREATRAPRRRRGSSAADETAPLVWATMRPPQDRRARARSRGTRAVLRSRGATRPRGARRLELGPLAASRVREGEARGVQRETAIRDEGPRHAAPGPRRGFPAAVEPIADDRVADEAQVDTDLVRAAGFRMDLQEGDRPEAGADAVERAGGPPIVAHGHLHASLRVAPDGTLDEPAWPLRPAPHERLVRLLDRARLELVGERPVRGVGLGDHQDTRGLFVEPVDDSRSFDAADAGEIGAVVKQGVHQRAAARARAGMDRHPGGLVKDQEIGRLVEDRDRQGLGLEGGRPGAGRLDLGGAP